MEEWKRVIIDGIEWNYEVSSHGRIRNLRGKIKDQQDNGKGYLFVNLYRNGQQKNFYVHRLVANAFIPNPHNLTDVNHIDENKTNNCVENLEWVSHKNNMSHGTWIERRKVSHIRKS